MDHALSFILSSGDIQRDHYLVLFFYVVNNVGTFNGMFNSLFIRVSFFYER